MSEGGVWGVDFCKIEERINLAQFGKHNKQIHPYTKNREDFHKIQHIIRRADPY